MSRRRSGVNALLVLPPCRRFLLVQGSSKAHKHVVDAKVDERERHEGDKLTQTAQALAASKYIAHACKVVKDKKHASEVGAKGHWIEAKYLIKKMRTAERLRNLLLASKETDNPIRWE